MAPNQEPLLVSENGNIKELTGNEITRRRPAFRPFTCDTSPFLADYYGFGRPSIFAFSLLALIPLAERISFVTEQIAYHTGPTVGGLLNATCLNATEIIIAMFALNSNKVAVVKYSLLGSVLSNLLLVLGTPLFSGGIATISPPQEYDRRQAGVNSLMLLLALLCHMLPMLFRYATSSTALSADPSLQLSRASSIVIVHSIVVRVCGGDNRGCIGLMGCVISFLGIILLPTVANAAEHAEAVILPLRTTGTSLWVLLWVLQLKLACLWFPSV
ncbi:hypothetical protein K1719_034274 [Acacia pycnantha]|nr:hypothetical protein K1719_034274 [Acacia pycnantha]